MSRRVLVVVLLAVGLAGGAAVPWLLAESRALAAETAALRGRRAPAAAALDSLVGLTDAVRATLVAERIRAASRAESTLHLALDREAGTLLLVRDGLALRRMAVRVDGRVPEPGVRSIDRLVETLADTSPVVDSLGMPVPGVRRVPATVDRIALDDGTLLRGDDASTVLVPVGGTTAAPAIVLARRDLAAIRPNLVRGMKLFAW